MKNITLKNVTGTTWEYENQPEQIVNIMKTFAENINDVSVNTNSTELIITVYTPTAELIFEALIKEYIK